MYCFQEKVECAVEFLEDYKNGTAPKYSDEQLWQWQRIKNVRYNGVQYVHDVGHLVAHLFFLISKRLLFSVLH